MEFDLKGARAAGYSDAEIAEALGPRFDFDVDGARKAGYSDKEIVDTLTASPTVGDYAKSLAGGVLSGAGMIAQGGGELLARGVNAVAGTNLRAENPLQGAVDWLEKSQTPAARRAVAESQITGSLFDPGTWDFGKNPTLSGLALQGVNAIGQFAPNLAIALTTAGMSVPAQLAVGATVGGMQALGGGAGEERARFQAMTDAELKQSSTLYRELIAKGVDPQTAKEAVAESAALGGGLGNAIPSAAKGAFENFLVGALLRGRVKVPGKGIIGKATVGASAGAALGGTEEAIEQIGQNIGSNIAIGGTRELSADTLQQFVMGALAEGVVGGGGGAIQSAFGREEPTAPPAPAVEQKTAQAVSNIARAPTVDAAIDAAIAAVQDRQNAVYLTDVAESVAGEGIISEAMGGAVDRAQRALMEEPAYQQLEAQRERERAEIRRQALESGLPPADPDDMQLTADSAAMAPEKPASPQMRDAWGKVVLERMEALERAKAPEQPSGLIQQAMAPVESADAKTGAPRPSIAAGVRNLADDEATVSQPAQQAVSVLRGEGDQRVSGMAHEFLGLPQGRGPEAIAGIDAGSNRQREELRARERALGAPGGAVAQPAQRDEVRAPGQSVAPVGVGVGDRPSAQDAQGARADLRLADRPSADGAGQRNLPSSLDAAAHEAAVSPLNDRREPTKKQILAGNAKLGHPKLGGLELSIENPSGSVREDKHNTPPKWRTEMKGVHYGYVRDSIGFDKDHLDIFVKEGTPPDWTGMVYVVNQNKRDGKLDEHKSMAGFESEAEARAAYLAQYERGWEKNVRSIVAMPMAYFEKWATDKTGAGPRGGEAKPILILGKRVDQHTRKALEVAAKSAKTRAQREMAQAELDRRDAEKDARPMSEAEQKRRERLSRQAQARKRIDVDRDSLIPAIIKLGGIHVRNRNDIIGDKGNRGLLGVGYLFNERGTDLDDLAVRLSQYGYITEAELADRRDTGGVNLLAERIRDEFDGRRTHWSISGNAAERLAAERAAMEEEQAAEDAQAAAAEMGADLDLAISPEDLAEGAATPEDAAREELLARAAAVDEAGFERLAMQHAEASDAEFMAAVVQFLKEREGADQRPNEAGVREGEAAGQGPAVSGQDRASPREDEGASQAAEVARPSVEDLKKYAAGVVSAEIPRVYLVGSAVSSATPKDIDLLYELKADLGEDPEGAIVDIVERSAVDAEKYDTFYQVGDRYFHLSSGAGRSIVENTEYAKEQAGKPRVLLAEHSVEAKREATNDRPALELTSQTEQDLQAKEKRAAEGDAEQRAAAVRDRDSAVLTPPEGTAPARDVTEQKVPTQQQGLFGNAITALRTAADELQKVADGTAERARSKAPAAGERITDVGENLWYNRRNFTRGATTWDDVKNLNDTLKVKEVVKAKVWPKPNYEQLVADGMQPFFARMLKQVYDGIATEPAGKSDADLQRYISVVGRVREAVFEWAKDNNANRDFITRIAERAKAMSGRRISLMDMVGDRAGIQNVILDRVWPVAETERNYRFRRDSEALEEIRAIGGNRALKHLQFTMDDAVEAMKDLDKGWPKAQEAWQRQGYRIVPSSEAVVTEGGYYEEGKRVPKWFVNTASSWSGRTISEHATKEEAEAARQAMKPFMLLDKRGRLVSQHDAQDEAKEAARELTKRESKGGEIRGMNIEQAERTGPARRKPDENVSADRLMQEFGFRGVNFGREGWINQAERQAYLNHAHDALLDLAEIMDVPPKALSLNGMLGIAFGAQGRGGRAAAHFVPGVNEINLTKTMGAGTLAHEWGHALDHYFATQAGLAKSDEPYMSAHAPMGQSMKRTELDGGRYVTRDVQRFGDGIRPEIVSAFKDVVETMEKRPMTEAEFKAREEMAKKRAMNGLENWLQHFRKDIERTKTDDKALELFDQAAERLRKGDTGDGYVKVRGQTLPAVVGAIKLVVRDHTKSSSVDLADNYKGLASNAQHVAFILQEKKATDTHVPQMTNTAYAAESSRKDHDKKGKPYWRTRWEMFARAFETYVADRLAAAKQSNTFLSDAALRAEARDQNGGFAMPYPRGEDRERINGAIDKLVNAIESKETDQGVAMFSRKKVTESDEFKQWFGDSKVVDESGRPLIVYHGTPTKSRAISNFRVPAYFTEEPTFAAMFAMERDTSGGALYPVYLKIESPYIINAAEQGRHFEWDAEDVQRMKADGFDGVIVRGDEGESDIYTVFDQTQIKSAVGNTGAFDPENGDIRFSRRSNRPTFEKDADGPILVGDDVAIVQPAAWETRGKMTMYEHTIAARNDKGQMVDVGRVTLGWENDRVVFLPDIRLYSGNRSKGTGEKVLRMILEHNGMRAEPLVIGYITDSAAPFWRKMGVRIYDTGEGNDGAVDLDAYLSARPDQAGEDPKFRRPGQGLAAPLGQDEEAAGADPGRAQSRQVGLTASAIRQALQPVLKAWGNAPTVHVIDSMAEAPGPVRKLDEGQRKGGAGGEPEAFFWNDAVYLVAGSLNSTAEVYKAVLHESLGHYGLRGTFGDRLVPILDDVARAMPVRIAQKAKEYGLDLTVDKQRRLAAEEVLAEMAQTMPRATLVQRLVAAIRQFLRSIGVDLELSEQDIIANFILPARRFVERGRAPSASLAGAAFHRAFHGSRHDFDRFSLGKIGTGEGAQAYGWGLYFAGNKDVAEWYRKTTSTTQWMLDGKPLNNGGEIVNREMYRLALALMDIRDADVDNIGAALDKEIASLREHARFAKKVYGDAMGEMYEGKADVIERFKDRVTARRGRVYQVELAPNEDEYLDWDKPLPAQSDSVKTAIRSLGQRYAKEVELKDSARNERVLSGQELYRQLAREEAAVAAGGRAEGVAPDSAEDMKRASLRLAQAGIPGLKYLDGSSRDAGGGTHNYVIFDDSLVSIEAKFSRAMSIAGGPTTGDHRDALSANAASYIRDLLRSDEKFNWWHRTIGTQQHKAMVNADFAKVYDESQAFLSDVSKYANEAADQATSLLPRIEGFKDFAKKSASKADIEAATQALYAGTLYGGGSPLEGRVWTDEELRTGRARDGRITLPMFEPLNDRQIGLYREALASVSKSLDELGKSLIHRVARQHGIGFDREMSLEDVAQSVRDQAEDQIVDLSAELQIVEDPDYIKDSAADAYEVAGGDRRGERAAAAERARLERLAEQLNQQIEQLEGLKKQVDDIEAKTTGLKAHGYFPAMRFGRYAVHVVRDIPGEAQPEQLFFGLYESQTKANLAARELAKEHPDARIERGIVSQEQHRLFQGMSLDALETFADYITGENGEPIAKDPLVQGFLKAAVAERSSLKRHIHRKGIAGYSDDLPRVLASFTVASARTTSSNYHSAEMLRLAGDIKAGDVKDEAIKLVRYLMDPQEEAQALRGFLFAQFLGGSIAHGLVNMTQPFMVTVPYLSQFTSVADAAAKVAQAAGARPEKLTGAIRAAYERAKKEGVVAPQEIHQLRAETGGLPLAKNLALRKLSFLWGSIYAVTEQFNRSSAFLAAYRVAEAKRIEDPYQFAVNAVNETQFVYNKGNRPNWARGSGPFGPAGPVIFTFKQFSISYLELGKRLYAKDKKAFALMTLMLLAAAGLEGLPFAEDIEDLVDTIGQWMGYSTNSKKQLRRWATAVLGKDLADIALHGISGFSWMPVDVSVRMGLQNLVPGTAMLKLSEKNKAQDVLEIVGPVGQFVPTEGTMMGRALERIAQGDYFAAAKAGAPVAAQNVLKGAEWSEKGYATDTKGKRIADISPAEGVLKMAGLQPATVARESRRIGEVMQDVELQRRMESEIAEQWARGLVDKEPAEIQAAIRKLREWNEANPGLRIAIRSDQIRRRVKEMRTPREERMVKRAPPEIRSGVREALR